MNPYIDYIRRIKTTARDLRQRQTPSEALLWELLRDRTWIINQLGIKVIRFKNEELEDPTAVLAAIAAEFKQI
jgi:very-short-patch-repair endonuclease